MLRRSPLRTLVLALLPLVGAYGCDSSGGAWERSAGGGKTAPTLATKTIEGEYVALSDFRGTVVLVNVWATWCKPCMKELPELAHLQREHAAKGFTVLGVSVDKRRALGKVHQLIKHHQLAYPMLVDPEGSALAGWEITGYPTSVLVGRDGTVRWRRNGIIEPNDPELAKQLEAALAEPAPADPS